MWLHPATSLSKRDKAAVSKRLAMKAEAFARGEQQTVTSSFDTLKTAGSTVLGIKQRPLVLLSSTLAEPKEIRERETAVSFSLQTEECRIKATGGRWLFFVINLN